MRAADDLHEGTRARPEEAAQLLARPGPRHGVGEREGVLHGNCGRDRRALLLRDDPRAFSKVSHFPAMRKRDPFPPRLTPLLPANIKRNERRGLAVSGAAPAWTRRLRPSVWRRSGRSRTSSSHCSGARSGRPPGGRWTPRSSRWRAWRNCTRSSRGAELQHSDSDPAINTELVVNHHDHLVTLILLFFLSRGPPQTRIRRSRRGGRRPGWGRWWWRSAR